MDIMQNINDGVFALSGNAGENTMTKEQPIEANKSTADINKSVGPSSFVIGFDFSIRRHNTINAIAII
ncbi:hypothetical protein KIQ45_004440 [Salmonella enterica]|nr:hypothetical protein [Salmonella enterica]